MRHICRGIGLETSLLFAQEGANIVLADINLAAVEKLSNTIKERYPNVKSVAVKCDVSKESEVQGSIDLAVKEFGRLDVMVSGFLSQPNALCSIVPHS